jgi:hypothetical protein
MVCRFVCIEMCRQKISRHMILGRDVREILSKLLFMFLGTIVSSTKTPTGNPICALFYYAVIVIWESIPLET